MNPLGTVFMAAESVELFGLVLLLVGALFDRDKVSRFALAPCGLGSPLSRSG